MRSKMKSFFVLALIVLFAFAVRIYQIGSIPEGSLIDEAHFGYIAFSLLETGKDEHGISYPLVFKGFGDNKLPAQAYLMMPVVKFFGLSNATIRYPSVLAGTLLVLVMFFFIKELGLGKKSALVGSLIVAISPWSFFLSRFGFESNLGLFFFTTGLLFLLKTIKEKSYWFPVLAGFFLSLTWYSYISYRPVTLGIVILFLSFLAFTKKLKNHWPQVRLLVISLVVFIAPLFAPGLAGVNNTRLKQIGILNDPQVALIVNEDRNFCDARFPRLACDLIWNKATVVGHKLAFRFFHTYSPQYLVTEGEAENVFLTINGFGQFYLVFYPLLIVGAFYLFKKKLPKGNLPVYSRVLLSLGLLLAPIPTILVGSPQQVRLSPLFPFLVVVIVIGISATYRFLKEKWQKIVFGSVIALSLIFQSANFFVNYFAVHTVKNESYYQSYLPGLFEFIKTLEGDEEIYFKPFFSDPLMFYAYYTHMDPAIYQEQAVLGEKEKSGFQHTISLDKVHVTNDLIKAIGCSNLEKGNRAIFVTNEPLPSKLIYSGQSTGGVHTFVYAYDATFDLEPEDCSS